jgi:hypothetical protein
MQESMDTELCLYTIRETPQTLHVFFVSFLVLGWITPLIGVRRYLFLDNAPETRRARCVYLHWTRARNHGSAWVVNICPTTLC